jgi:hypothetical protein
MSAPHKNVGYDHDVVIQNVKRIDDASVADAPALVTAYQVGGSGTDGPGALSNFLSGLDETLAAIAKNAKALNATVAANTDAMRQALEGLKESDDVAKSEVVALQELIEQQPAQPARSDGTPASKPAPAAGAPASSPTGPDGRPASEYFEGDAFS